MFAFWAILSLFLYLDRIGFGAILEQMLHVLVNEVQLLSFHPFRS